MLVKTHFNIFLREFDGRFKNGDLGASKVA